MGRDGRAGARRRRCGRPRRRRRRALLRQAAARRPDAAAPVDRRARAGGGARRAVQGDGRIPGDRRLRHRDGRAHRAKCWRWSACPTTTPTLRLDRRRTTASTAPSTGMYEPGSTFKLQTASMALDSGIVHIWDEFDASRTDPYRPLHHHRLRGQASLALSAGSAGLFVQPRRRAHRAGGRRRAAARLAAQHGHVRPHRHRAAGGRRCRSSRRRRTGRRSRR